MQIYLKMFPNALNKFQFQFSKWILWHLSFFEQIYAPIDPDIFPYF